MKRRIAYRREYRRLEREFHKLIEEGGTEEDQRRKAQGIEKGVQKRKELLRGNQE
ncbi:MAG: hypothetical protein IJY11_04090 [Clostridia bacterium]|nr:hypothetical protein [Clostridia bacterium]